MPIPARALTVAAVAAVVAGGVAVPAGVEASAVTAAKPKTELVAAITAQTPKIHLRYFVSHLSITEQLLRPGYAASTHAAAVVARVPADAAQLPAKLEWILGVDMQGSGDAAILYGQEHDFAYGHATAGARAWRAGIEDYRLSNYYVGHADSQLEISHPARTAEPFSPSHKDSIPAGPGTLRTPVGLTATIAMGTPVLHESLPRDIETASVGTNTTAARYYALTVSRMHVDAAQRSAQRVWVKGVQTQLRGDEQLARGENTHTTGSPATGNREMKDALGILRTANSEIGHADALLGIHSSGPSVTMPSHVIYYKG